MCARQVTFRIGIFFDLETGFAEAFENRQPISPLCAEFTRTTSRSSPPRLISWLEVYCFAGLIRKPINLTTITTFLPVAFGSLIGRIHFRLTSLARSPEVILRARRA